MSVLGNGSGKAKIVELSALGACYMLSMLHEGLPSSCSTFGRSLQPPWSIPTENTNFRRQADFQTLLTTSTKLRPRTEIRGKGDIDSQAVASDSAICISLDWRTQSTTWHATFRRAAFITFLTLLFLTLMIKEDLFHCQKPKLGLQLWPRMPTHHLRSPNNVVDTSHELIFAFYIVAINAAVSINLPKVTHLRPTCAPCANLLDGG